MKYYFTLICVFILGLTSCRATNQPSSIQTPVALFPTITTTPARLIPTSTISTTATPEPRPATAPTATPLPVTLLAEKGYILIWDDRAKQYWVLDLSTGNAPDVLRWNPECEWELLPHATKTVCEHKSGQQYLLDILTGSELDLPISNAKLIGWDPNGRFLVFTRVTENKTDIFSYNITTNVTQTLALGIGQQEQEQWLTQPALSADGLELIVIRATSNQQSASVFEIVKKGLEFQQKGLSAPLATADVAWSPRSRQLVYGATDIKQEISPSPNYLFIVDVSTNKIRKLAQAPQSLFFWSSSLSWSPKGNQVAVGLWDLSFKSEPQACMIDVNTVAQVCLPAFQNISGRFLAWSPSGDHIAFVDLGRNLIVSNTNGTGALKLFENVPHDFLLFWR